jgi:hypothetical protein
MSDREDNIFILAFIFLLPLLIIYSCIDRKRHDNKGYYLFVKHYPTFAKWLQMEV